MLTETAGGRTRPAVGSYRPNHNFGSPHDTAMEIGFIEIPAGTELRPGASMETKIAFHLSETLKRELRPGRRWRIQEGAKLVGFGKILEVDAEPEQTVKSRSRA